MGNKYYTPDISEFHVGFEYEALDRGNNTWSSVSLTHKILSQVLAFPLQNKQYGFLSYIEMELAKECIRVKCLDKEDIESLGFTQLKTPIWFHKDGVSLFNSGVYDLRISLWPREDNIRITISYPGVDDESIFVGKCKNKSELKRILKMIGYENSYR